MVVALADRSFTPSFRSVFQDDGIMLVVNMRECYYACITTIALFPYHQKRHPEESRLWREDEGPVEHPFEYLSISQSPTSRNFLIFILPIHARP
jgi:hypothetical protein